MRVDTGVRAGDAVSPFYDPMLAKLIVWGEDRDAACAAMLAALAQCEVVGVATNIAFLERVVAHEAFATARLDTGLIDKNRDALFPPPSPPPERALLAAAAAEYEGIALDALAAARGVGGSAFALACARCLVGEHRHARARAALRRRRRAGTTSPCVRSPTIGCA